MLSVGTQIDKLKDRLSGIPSDFTFDELYRLLTHLGYQPSNKGSTSGSSVMFCHPEDKRIIMLHKPHPGSIVKQYILRDIKKKLQESGDLDE